MQDWLQLAGKTVLVAGVAGKRSVGFHVGQRLLEAGARVLWTVRTPERKAELAARLEGPILVCDVRHEQEIEALRETLTREHPRLDGFVHSIAHGDYSDGWKPFHETGREAFLGAVDVSAYSLIRLANAFKELLTPKASVVAVSISSTRTAAENYGFMAPVKAALDSSVVFLAKSFSAFSEVRFNAVCAGPLKTASSAGIPGYLESYLFAEQLTLRKRGLATGEVADSVLWLLSPRSAGVNAQGLVVDAGMGVNAFDAGIVHKATRPEGMP